jgi:large subunit ribosomal protein L23
MKLIKPELESHPKNKVQFIVSSEMTRLDVKNYLEKIYKVPVMDVRTLNHTGEMIKNWTPILNILNTLTISF